MVKKILWSIGAVVLVVVAVVWFFFGGGITEHIEDTNGDNYYTLNTITDSNIINLDVGSMGLKKSKSIVSDTVTYSSDKFSGVTEIFGENMIANRLDITVNHASVNSGNFRIVLVQDDEIVHEFKLNELTQSFTLENPKGYVALRIAGESADFMFDYHID